MLCETMLRCFFTLALLINGTLPLMAHDGHLILLTKSTTTLLEYHSGHKATWCAEVIDATDNIVKYTLTLVRPATDDGKEPISLYNLRLQGGGWSVRIADAKPGVEFYNSLAEALAPVESRKPIQKDSNGEWPIAHAALRIAQGDMETKPERVAVMRWARDGSGKDNTCTIVVYSNRKIRGPLSKFNAAPKDEIEKHRRMGHHSEPPPGTPGGEEGEPR